MQERKVSWLRQSKGIIWVEWVEWLDDIIFFHLKSLIIKLETDVSNGTI